MAKLTNDLSTRTRDMMTMLEVAPGDCSKLFDANETPSVCILGLGYVGLTLSSVLADVGCWVTGVDRDHALIEGVKAGKAPFFEKGLEELLARLSSGAKPPRYATSLPEPCADVYIITVGTPIMRPSLEPNLDYVRAATTEVAKVLRRGNLVILRSTVPVGTTRKVVLPVLEAFSGLEVGKDFGLAFCPERTIEGRALRELRELPQIIGGFDESSARAAQFLFQRSTATVIDLGSIEAAEMLKILDNTYRDMAFAYANQMALVCEAVGLEMGPIVRASNQGYNRNSIPVPSPGVGGACLSKDPYILASVCRQVGIDPTLFIRGRQINEYMPIHVVERVCDALAGAGKKVAGSTVFVLGFAFKGKPETSDMRDSPTLDLVRTLHRRGIDVTGHDPLVAKGEIQALGVEVLSLEEGFSSAQAVIVMIDHPLYAGLDIKTFTRLSAKPLVLMDGWHLYANKNLDDDDGLIYLTI
jgi:UDP-N-acetyl-D-mannosaminuronic acid dehydrogenase